MSGEECGKIYLIKHKNQKKENKIKNKK